MPTMWNFIWLIGIITNGLFKPKEIATNKMLSWLRLRALLKRSEQIVVNWSILFSIISVLKAIWLLVIKKKHGNVGGLIHDYFTPPWPHADHPIKKLAQGIDF
jgi:hypothetical protein